MFKTTRNNDLIHEGVIVDADPLNTTPASSDSEPAQGFTPEVPVAVPTATATRISPAKCDISPPTKCATYATDAPPKLQLREMVQMSDSFALNFMVVGESGLGKTTFLKAICACLPNEPTGVLPHDGQKTVGEPSVIFNHEFKESGVKYKFSAVDAAGFEVKENLTITGDRVDREANFQPIMQYIQNKQDQWAQHADPDGRSEKPDERIHCLFYFVRPHRVQEIDLAFMQRFSKVVNIVPIIAKADTLTRDELTKQLRELQARLTEHQIKIFDFGETENPELQFLSSEEELQQPDYSAVGAALAGQEVPLPPLPRNRNVFAVITSAPGTARQYVYGTASMMDKRHSDFPRLVDLLFEEGATQLRELRRKALDKANSRIRLKTNSAKVADHPVTPPVSFGLAVILALCFFSAEPSLTCLGRLLLCVQLLCALGFFSAGMYAKRKQDLPFRYRFDRMVLYAIIVLAFAFACFAVYKMVVVSDPRQFEVAALNATLANTTATAELTQFQLAESMRTAVRTATELATSASVVNGLEKEVTKLAEQLETSKRQQSALTKQLETSETSSDQEAKQAAKKEKEVATLTKQLETSQNRADQEAKQAAKKEKEMATLTKQLETSQNRADQEAKQAAKKEKEMAKLTKQLKTSQNRADQEAKQAAKKEKEMAKLAKQLELKVGALEAELETSQYRTDQEAKQAAKKEKEMAKLTKQLKTSQNRCLSVCL
jgi:septin family protein